MEWSLHNFRNFQQYNSKVVSSFKFHNLVYVNLAYSIPMYITQKGDGVTICLAENENTKTVVQIPKEQCFKPAHRNVATWKWMGSHNLQ